MLTAGLRSHFAYGSVLLPLPEALFPEAPPPVRLVNSKPLPKLPVAELLLSGPELQLLMSKPSSKLLFAELLNIPLLVNGVAMLPTLNPSNRFALETLPAPEISQQNVAVPSGLADKKHSI